MYSLSETVVTLFAVYSSYIALYYIWGVSFYGSIWEAGGLN